MTNSTLPDQVQELWRTRPVRLPDQGPVAGVAAGLGYRYRIDPVLIRVAFAVATVFGGSGIALYIACWLAFTKPGEQYSPAEVLLGRGRNPGSDGAGTSTTAIVLAVALAISVVALGVGLGGSGPVSIALMLGGWWLLHQRTPVPPAMPTAATVPLPSRPLPGQQQWGPYTTLPKEYVPSDTDNPSQSQTVDLQKKSEPPSWDPLGVAPFAWDLPDPSAPAPVVPNPKRKKSHFTSTFLGLAILASAITAAISAGDGSTVDPVTVAGVGLAVVALGLIVGAFARRGYGLLIVATPLAGFVILGSAIDPSDFQPDKLGNQVAAPTTMNDLASSYSGGFGNIELDLRGLTLTADRTVDVESNFGNVEITVPDGMNVRADCTSTVGNTECLPSDPSQTSGPVLTLNVDSSVGNVEVRRG